MQNYIYYANYLLSLIKDTHIIINYYILINKKKMFKARFQKMANAPTLIMNKFFI